MIKRWATFEFGIDFGANFKSNRIIANWSRRREGKEIHVKRVPLYTLYDWGKVIRWKDTDGWVAGWEHQMKTSLYTQRCSYLPMWCRLCAARVYGGGWWEGVELQFAARRIASSDRILSSLYSLAEGNERTTWVGGRERELNCAGEANLNASLSRFCYSAQPLLSPPSLFSSPLPPLTAHQHLPLVLYSLYFAALQTHLITPIQVDFSLFFFFFISSTCILSMCCVYSSFNSSLSPSLFFLFCWWIGKVSPVSARSQSRLFFVCLPFIMFDWVFFFLLLFLCNTCVYMMMTRSSQ